MAGQPYWTQDIGGFFVRYPNGERNPEYRELFTRWNQFGIFNPIYRIHGTNIEREPYIFKDMDLEVYDALLDARPAALSPNALHLRAGLAVDSRRLHHDAWHGDGLSRRSQRPRAVHAVYVRSRAPGAHGRQAASAGSAAAGRPPFPRMPLTRPDGKPGACGAVFRGYELREAFRRGRCGDCGRNIGRGRRLADLPGGLAGASDFSDRWEGFISMPEDGEYEIGAEGDDGVRVWLDGKLIVDDWSAHGMRWKGQRLSCKQGQKVALKIEHFQGGGGRGLRLGWKTPSKLATESQLKPSNKLATYLPAGTWYDFWTNERMDGGREVERPCPMDIFPLYVRAGSIVPMGPEVEFIGEQPDAPYEIRIYPGADASFTIYEDDGRYLRLRKG